MNTGKIIAGQDENISFSLQIEKIVKETNMSYIDAMLYYAEQKGIEMAVLAKMVTGTLKSKIKIEAQDLHFLPKPTTKKLPI